MAASGLSADPDEIKATGCLAFSTNPHRGRQLGWKHSSMVFRFWVWGFFWVGFFCTGKKNQSLSDRVMGYLGMLDNSFCFKQRGKKDMQNFCFDELALGGNNTLRSLTRG